MDERRGVSAVSLFARFSPALAVSPVVAASGVEVVAAFSAWAWLRAVELLLSGVTCVNDMFVHYNPDAMASLGVVSGLRSAGLRGVVSFGAEDLDRWGDVARMLGRSEGAVESLLSRGREALRRSYGEGPR